MERNLYEHLKYEKNMYEEYALNMISHFKSFSYIEDEDGKQIEKTMTMNEIAEFLDSELKHGKHYRFDESIIKARLK